MIRLVSVFASVSVSVSVRELALALTSACASNLICSALALSALAFLVFSHLIDLLVYLRFFLGSDS